MCVGATRARGRGRRRAGARRLRGAARGGRHDRSAHASRPRSCTTNGATTSSSRRWSTTISRKSAQSARDHACAGTCARRARRCRRSKAAACCASGTSASASSRCTARRRCRTSIARDSRSASASTRASIRVIAPDVGGGFGYKGILLPEEICLAWLARQSRRARCAGSKTAASSSRRTPTAASTITTSRSTPIATGGCSRSIAKRRSIRARIRSYPFSACLEAAQVGSILPGPYKMERYRCRTWSVATNKPRILPYRGVARTGVCFALEVALDARRARSRARSRTRCGSRTSCSRTRCRTTTSRRSISTRGDYPEAVRRAVDALDVAEVARAPESRASRRAPHRRRLRGVLRAGGARHVGVLRLGHPDGARATSSASRGSRPTACSSCASARTRTARAWRPRSRRSRTRCSASIPRTCA